MLYLYNYIFILIYKYVDICDIYIFIYIGKVYILKNDIGMMRKKILSRCSSLKSQIFDIKDTVNNILENGAYSDKNFNVQMNKKGNNYNMQEQLIVAMAYRQKQFLGEQLQKEFIDRFKENTEMLEWLKNNDNKLYEIITKIINGDDAK